MRKQHQTPTIYKEEYVMINGIEQFLYHRGHNRSNPVMLFLHGGPGSVESIFAHLFQDKWEHEFTVVHWDQRGSGKTLLKNMKSYPTAEQLIEDTHEVIAHLKKQYKVDQVIIFGHSWGSVLGSFYIQAHPEDVAYYIGAGQVVNMMENERVGYERLRTKIMEANDTKSLKTLEAIGTYPGETFDMKMYAKCGRVRALQSKYDMAFGPSWPLIKQVFKSPIVNLKDAFAMMYAPKSNSHLINYLGSVDIERQTMSYEVPIYYLLGEKDWQTPYPLAMAYFDKITAPNKKVYLIKEAGHMMMMDQEELVLQALMDIKCQEGKQI